MKLPVVPAGENVLTNLEMQNIHPESLLLNKA
jgi:hypothetical protein